MAVDVRVRVEGLDELRAALRKADKVLAKDLGQAGKRAADIVAQAAKPKIPVRSGRARASLRAVVVSGGGGVKGGGAKAPYFGFLDYGNKVLQGNKVGRGDTVTREFKPGGRYVYVSLAEKRDEVVDTYEDLVRDVLRRAGLT